MNARGADEYSARARAKLNLYLHVLDRRADGYHELDSLIAFAQVGDDLTVAPAERLTLAVEGPFAAALGAGGQAGNLVWRAAMALAAAAEIAPRAAIRLVKNLPVSSGIGGGSADAAAALVLLQRLWRIRLAPARLSALALALGADVPMCLEGRPAYAGGVGECLAPVPTLPLVHAVLAHCGVAVSTKDVFQRRAGSYSAPAARFSAPPADAHALAALLAGSRNDLTKAAIAIAPEIADCLAALGEAQGCLLARMSGSGATCFGLFADAAAAAAACARLASRYTGWWVAATALARD
ncbi:MAG: 4-(cytidine 5'-diphospho)-2-C-methyl-D-erythritol kinase [Alphaproteobacteria bacterium]